MKVFSERIPRSLQSYEAKLGFELSFAPGLASELKMKSYSTLKIPRSLLRGVSMLKKGHKWFFIPVLSFPHKCKSKPVLTKVGIDFASQIRPLKNACEDLNSNQY